MSESPESSRRRSARKREVRAVTQSRRHLHIVSDVGRRLWPPDPKAPPAPATRGGCGGVPRPCPYVSCKHNLYLDLLPNGSLKLNFPDLEPWEVPAAWSRALDVADRGGTTLERVGEAMNMVRERVRQVEDKALVKLAASLDGVDLERDGPGGDRTASREVVTTAGPATVDADAYEGFDDLVTEHLAAL